MQDADGVTDAGEPPAPRRLRILVVDDHMDGGTLFSVVLEALGHDTKLLASADNLVEEVRTFKPDAVFLDLLMPGTDGREAARRLRREADFRDVFLIAHTACGRPRDIEECFNIGFDAYLLKPVQENKLHSVLAEVGKRVYFGTIPRNSIG